MSKNNFKFGEWNVICDSCGFKFKSGKLTKRWDGFMVCSGCYEQRHPMDFLKTKPDKQDLPWSRPKQSEIFIENLALYGSDESITLTDVPSISGTYSRVFSDSMTLSDEVKTLLSDIFPVDSFSFSDTPTITFTATRPLTETLSISSLGFITQNDYVDNTYMLENYVGVAYSFS